MPKQSKSKFDHHTKDGRAAIDNAVRKKLSSVTEKSRGMIADALSLEAHVVSASLRRLVSSGVAKTRGGRGQRVYVAA